MNQHEHCLHQRWRPSIINHDGLVYLIMMMGLVGKLLVLKMGMNEGNLVHILVVLKNVNKWYVICYILIRLTLCMFFNCICCNGCKFCDLLFLVRELMGALKMICGWDTYYWIHQYAILFDKHGSDGCLYQINVD